MQVLKLILGLFCIAITSGFAQTSTEAAPDSAETSISTLENPLKFPYHLITEALAVFKKRQHLAANASMNLYVFKAHLKDDSNPGKLRLQLKNGEHFSDIPLNDQGRLSLPPEPIQDEDAYLLLNKNAKAYRILADVHSPGVPADSRRFGDLRLECEMDLVLAQDHIGPVLRAAIAMIDNPCQIKPPFYKSDFGFPAPKPLKNVYLHAGERRESLPADRILAHGHAYAPPINDLSWPDDALVEFEY